MRVFHKICAMLHHNDVVLYKWIKYLQKIIEIFTFGVEQVFCIIVSDTRQEKGGI